MRKLLTTTCFLTTFFLGFDTATAQLRVVRYSENFVGGTTYCPGTANYDNWVSFRRALDTSSLKFTSVTLQGDNNATAVTGRVCNNEFLTRRIAESLRAGTTFNVSCNGNTWDIGGAGNCFTGCASSTDQVALSVRGAGTSCACANPAWALNACIGNANWGGVNTNNCPPPSQRSSGGRSSVAAENLPLLESRWQRPSLGNRHCWLIAPASGCTLACRSLCRDKPLHR